MSLLLVLLAMEVAGGYLLTTLNRQDMATFAQNVTTQGRLLGSFLEPYLARSGPTRDLSPLIAQFGSVAGEETIVLDRYGKIVGTSGIPGSVIGDKVSSPLATAALGGRRMAVYSKTKVGQQDLELALPIRRGGQTVGVVEITALLTGAEETIASVRRILIIATLLALLAALVVGLALSGMVTRPVRRLTERVSELASGRFETSPGRWSEDEVGDLGRAFDRLSQRLDDTLGAMADEKQKLETVLYHMSDGLVALDESGAVVLSNPPAERFLGSPLPPGSRPDALEPLRDLPYGASATGHGPEDRTFRMVAAPRSGGDVKIVLISDVTAETRLEAMRQRFVADVGHELRTPLATLKSYLETLTSERRLKRPLREHFLAVARAEAERMARLVTDLLTLSQADSDRLVIRARPIAIGAIVDEALVRLAPALMERRLEVDRSGDGTLRVLADPDRMGQVLLNVLTNAIEFSPGGGRLEVSAAGSDRSVALRVVDQGPGIPDADLPHVFERFYRVDKARSRERGGTGLGLAIAQELVVAHGGRITAERTDGGGTAVTIALPAAPSNVRALSS